MKPFIHDTNHQLRLPLNSPLYKLHRYQRCQHPTMDIVTTFNIALEAIQIHNGINISGFFFHSGDVHRSYISKQGFPSPDGEETESSQRQCVSRVDEECKTST